MRARVSKSRIHTDFYLSRSGPCADVARLLSIGVWTWHRSSRLQPPRQWSMLTLMPNQILGIMFKTPARFLYIRVTSQEFWMWAKSLNNGRASRVMCSAERSPRLTGVHKNPNKRTESPRCLALPLIRLFSAAFCFFPLRTRVRIPAREESPSPLAVTLPRPSAELDFRAFAGAGGHSAQSPCRIALETPCFHGTPAMTTPSIPQIPRRGLSMTIGGEIRLGWLVPKGPGAP